MKPDQDVIGTINTANGPFDVVVERVTREKAAPVCCFRPRRLSLVPDVYDEVDLITLDRFLPDFLAKPRIAGIRLFDWLALFLLLPLCYRLLGAMNWLFKRPPPGLVRLVLLGIAIRWVLGSLDVPLFERQFWWGTSGLLITAAVVWSLILLNAYGEGYVIRNITGAGEVTSLLRLARRVADALVITGGLIIVFRYFGFDPTAALAGLGIGGIAVALAAQKALENVIAGLSLIFDKACAWATLSSLARWGPDTSGYGRRIRTLDRTIISVPTDRLPASYRNAVSTRQVRFIISSRWATARHRTRCAR